MKLLKEAGYEVRNQAQYGEPSHTCSVSVGAVEREGDLAIAGRLGLKDVLISGRCLRTKLLKCVK
jgi:hypothetical protein